MNVLRLTNAICLCYYEYKFSRFYVAVCIVINTETKVI